MVKSTSSHTFLVSKESRDMVATSPRRVIACAVDLSECAVMLICCTILAAVFAFDALLYSEYLKVNPSTHFNVDYVNPGALVTAHFNNLSAPLCQTPNCKWLSEYLKLKINRGADPCQDFDAYICRLHNESFVETGLWNLMHSLKQELQHRSNGSRPGSAEMIRACVRGDAGVVYTVLHQTEQEDIGSDCDSFTYPHLPLSISEKYVEGVGNGSVQGLLQYVLSQASQMTPLLLPEAETYPLTPPPWVKIAAERASRSASCYLKLRLNSMESIALYATLWKALYFSPFVRPVYKELRKTSLTQKPRLQACLDVADDIFPSEVRSAGASVLKHAVPDYREQVQRLVRDAIRSLKNHLRDWLSGNEHPVLNPLDTMKTLFLEETTSSHAEPLPALSTSTLYMARDNSLVIPQGLLAVLLTHATDIDSIIVPFLGADILRSLLLVPNATAWTPSDAEAWEGHRSCVHRQMNGSVLANDTVSSSMTLSPLFIVYRDHVSKQYRNMVRINGNFSNEQLFFVLWAAGRCGRDPDAVNAPLRNSERFTKAFRCTSGQGMVAEERCPFWIR